MMRKKPMLAYPVSDKPIDYTKPTFIQPKLDGVRCLIQYEQVTPLQTGPVAYSRTGKVWKNIDHILSSLRPFFQKYPNVILDGELYNHDFRDDFESIISMVRKTKPTYEDRSISRKNVQFHCYDIVDETIDLKHVTNLFCKSYMATMTTYIYYVWQAPMKTTWISIFHGNYGDGEDFECIFVGQPKKLIDKYKENTNDEG